MADYKKQAIFELEQGNYEQYQHFMKLHRLSRQEHKKTRNKSNVCRNSVIKSNRLSQDVRRKSSVTPPNNTLLSQSTRKQKKRTSNRTYVNGWNYQQRSFLKGNYQYMTDEELGNHLGRTAEAVKCERKKLKLSRQSANKRWTTDEDRFLLMNYKDMSFKEIGKKLDRKPKQVSARLAKLGGSKVNRYAMVVNGRTVCSGTIKEIAEQLNANLYTVKRWRTQGVSWAKFIKKD
ncbi:hypothetical protein [Enterococcus gilvus]|uniref:hypothetical protein n=1 Tax=Enterococcus gilvus TaxID=160453 RepID=UPI00345EF337